MVGESGNRLIPHLNYFSIQQGFFSIFGYTKSELGAQCSEDILCFFAFGNFFMDEKHFGIYTVL